jgi:rhodanese-related sulfurtransferase
MTKKIVYYFALLLSFTCVSQQADNYKTLVANDFNTAILKEKKVQLLDVRTLKEYDSGFIKNSKNINWFDTNFEKKITILDKNKPVFVYCKAGGRSAKACSKLAELGFTKIFNLNGGIESWAKAKKEVTFKK